MGAEKPATPGEVTGEAVRIRRVARRMAQAELGRRMASLGHPWKAATVSLSERALRRITVDELAALALVLGARPADLLDPGPLGGTRTAPLNVGGIEVPPRTARAWASGHLRLTLAADGSLSSEPVEGHEAAFADAVEELREARTTSQRRAPARRKGTS